jgi:hypothetical protein
MLVALPMFLIVYILHRLIYQKRWVSLLALTSKRVHLLQNHQKYAVAQK